MSLLNRHFDVAVLGDSLAARIAAVLLAKDGKRVLTLLGESAPSSPWTFPSLHLEKLLERLDGAGCRTVAEPLQLLGTEVRLEIHGSRPFDEELQREFPSTHRKIRNELLGLETLGRRLEEILWEQGLPLGGLGERCRFGATLLRRGLFGRRLGETAEEFFRKRLPGDAGEIFTALFSGLSVTPATRLSVAETALLWRGIARPHSVSLDALDQLLHQRYRQYHGSNAELDRLQAVHFERGRITGITLSGHGRLSCDHVLLGSSAVRKLLPQRLQNELRSGAPARRFVSSRIEGSLSPLLAGRVVLAGRSPLRVAFTGETGRPACSIEGPATPGTDMSPEDAAQALRPFLPFAGYRIEPLGNEFPEPCGKPRRPKFPGVLNRLKLSRNLLICDGSQLLPSLGPCGHLLTGFSVAERLLETKKKRRLTAGEPSAKKGLQ